MSCCTGVTKDTQSNVIHYGLEHVFTSRSKTGTVTIKSAGLEDLVVDSDSQQAPMPWVYDGTHPLTQPNIVNVYARNYELVDTISSAVHGAQSIGFSEDSAYLGLTENTANNVSVNIWKRTGDSWSIDYARRFDKCDSVLSVNPQNTEFIVQGNEYTCVSMTKYISADASWYPTFLNAGSWTSGTLAFPDFNQIYAYGTTMIAGYSASGIPSMSSELEITGTNGSYSVTGSIVAKSVLGFYNDTIVYEDAIYKKTAGTWASQATIQASVVGDIIGDTVVIGDASTFRWLTRTGSTWTSHDSLSIAHFQLKLLDTSNCALISTGGVVKVYNYTTEAGLINVASLSVPFSPYMAVGGTSRADKSLYIAGSGNPDGKYTAYIYKYTGLGDLVYTNTNDLQQTYVYECYTDIENTDMSLGSMAFSSDSKYFMMGDGYAVAAGPTDYNVLRVYKNIPGSTYEPMQTLVYRYSKTGPEFTDYKVNTSIAVQGNTYIAYNGSYSLTASDTTKGYRLDDTFSGPSWVLKDTEANTDYKPYLFTQTSGSISMILSNASTVREYTVDLSTGASSFVQNVGSLTDLLDFYADTALFTNKIYVKSGGTWSQQYTGSTYTRGSIIEDTVAWIDSGSIYWFTRASGSWTLTSSLNTGNTLIDVRLLTSGLVAVLDSIATVYLYELSTIPATLIRLAGTYRSCLSYPKLLTSGGTSNSIRKSYIAVGSSQTGVPLVSAVKILSLTSQSVASTTQVYSSIYVTGGSMSLIANSSALGTTATGRGSVTVTSTTLSTSTSTGALVVSGGTGIAGDLNMADLVLDTYSIPSVAGLIYDNVRTGALLSVALTTPVCTVGSLSMASFSTGALSITGSSKIGDVTCSELVCTSVNCSTQDIGYSEYVVLKGLEAYSQQGSKIVGTGNTGASSQGYGCSLSFDGGTLAFGGPSDNTNAGATWIWTRTGTAWNHQAKLIGTGGSANALQGYAVALSSDSNTVAIGGYQDNTNAGATWIFTRSGTTWSQQQAKLIGTGGSANAYQGYSVALNADGSTLAVGGRQDSTFAGATWIWTRSGTTWSQQQAKLVGTGGSANALQGHAVSLSADGNTLAVGAYQDNTNQGAVWIWTRSGSTWTQQQAKLIANNSTGAARQGHAVSLSADGSMLAVGGPNDNTSQGATWIWTRTAGSWTQQAKIVATGNTGAAEQGYGVGLSADGNILVVSGYADNSNIGAAWLFRRSGTSWTQISKHVGTGGSAVAQQGIYSCISGDSGTVASGAVNDNSAQGATWIFSDTSSQTIGIPGSDTKLTDAYWNTSVSSSFLTSHMTVTTGHISISRSGIYTMALTLPVPYNSGGVNPYARAAIAVTDSSGLNPVYMALDSQEMDTSVNPMILNCMSTRYLESGSRIQAELVQETGSSIVVNAGSRGSLTVYRGSSG